MSRAHYNTSVITNNFHLEEHQGHCKPIGYDSYTAVGVLSKVVQYNTLPVNGIHKVECVLGEFHHHKNTPMKNRGPFQTVVGPTGNGKMPWMIVSSTTWSDKGPCPRYM